MSISNNISKKKRKLQKAEANAQRIADAIVETTEQINKKNKENIALQMILGMHYAYKLLVQKYIEPYEKAETQEEKYKILVSMADEISKKHQSTKIGATEYCEKVGVKLSERL